MVVVAVEVMVVVMLSRVVVLVVKLMRWVRWCVSSSSCWFLALTLLLLLLM